MFKRSEIESVIIGGAVGDALGAPFEFFTEEEMNFISEIEMSGGTSKLMTVEPGEWTDDTEMTLSLAETLASGLPVNYKELTDRYINWANSYPKDIGTTTSKALFGSSGFQESTKRAQDFYQKTGRAAGNGTIMRAGPLAFIPVQDQDLKEIAKIEAGITHGAPEAFEASYIQAILIRKLLRNETLVIKTDGLSDMTKLALENYQDRDFVAKITSQGGTAWSSLAAGLWSLSFPDFKTGIREVIKLGCDTDTNAACAGSLLAAREGTESIPKEWAELLLNRPRIETAIDGLAELQDF